MRTTRPQWCACSRARRLKATIAQEKHDRSLVSPGRYHRIVRESDGVYQTFCAKLIPATDAVVTDKAVPHHLVCGWCAVRPV